jgi:Rrf2 family protein
MAWPGFPKRLQSALKALCCLAQTGTEMQAPAIAVEIDVPKSETAKILQLLVWGGFVSSRRGTKGGFRLAMPAEEITMGQVISFFMTRHPQKPEKSSPVMRALDESMAGAQDKFSNLTLSAVIKFHPPKAKTRARASGRNNHKK